MIVYHYKNNLFSAILSPIRSYNDYRPSPIYLAGHLDKLSDYQMLT